MLTRKINSALVILLAISGIAGALRAADQTWIVGAIDKTWSSTNPNWLPPGAAGGWDNGNNAIFGTLGETVTIGAPLTVGNMTFSVPTYVIGAVGGPNSLTLAGPSAIIDTSAAGGSTGTTLINAILAGSLTNGLTIQANGDIATGPGQGCKLAGVNTFTGDITILSGDLAFTANTALGNAANKIILNGGGLLDPNLSIPVPRPIQVLQNGGWIRLYGNVTAAAVYSGAMSGPGKLIHSDGGILTLAGDMFAFTGIVDQQGGGLSSAGVAGSTAITGILPYSNGNWITTAGTLGFDLGRFGTAGTVTMNGGTLQWRGSSLIRPSVPNDDFSNRITLVAGKTATFDTGNNTITVGGAFLGDPVNAPVTKIGTGQLNLTGTVSAGGVNVNAGVLSIQGMLTSNGPINVNSTGTLNVSGGLDPLSFLSVNSGGTLVCNLASGKTLGTVTLATGGTISPGAFASSGYIGTLRADSLTVNGGTLVADIGTTTNDLSVITGQANFSGAAVVQLRFAGAPAPGQRTLLTAGSIAGTTPTITTAPATTRYSVVPGGTLTDFIVTISGTNKDLVWSTTTGTWDVNSSPNWNSGADTFYNMDNVTFGPIAANATITLPLNVAPNNMTISNDANAYTFTGGIINGVGTLTKNGAGTATIAGDTTTTPGGTTFTNCVINGGILIFNCGFDQRDGLEFNGIVTINSGGTLQLGNTRIGTSPGAQGVNNFNIGTQFIINGGTVDVWERTDIGKITMTGGTIIGTAGIAGPGRLWVRSAGMQTLPSAVTSTIANGEWSLADNTVFNIGKGTTPSGVDLTISAIIDSPGQNYGIRKTGLGTMNITSASTYPFGTIIDAGTLTITGSGTIANNANNTVTINSNGTFALGRNDTWGGHTANVIIPIVINAGGTMTNLGGFYSTLGPVTLNGGTLTGIGGANIRLPTWGLKGLVTVGPSAAGSTISATGNLGAVALGEADVTGTTFNVADGPAAVDLLVSAQLWDGRDVANALFQPSSLTKTGPGTMLLTAQNIYSGATNVQAGKLIVDGTLTAASIVTVSSGAQLRGTGDGTTSGLISGTVTTNANALIIPGDTKGTTAAKGTLTISRLNMAAGGTVNIRMSKPALLEADLINVTSTSNVDLSAATLAVQAEAGTYGGQSLVVLQTTAGNYITKPFGTVPSDPAIKVAYLDSTNAVVVPDGVTPATFAAKVRVTLNTGVTPATIDSFVARPEGAGVLLSWNCVSEFQNVGFNVYRRLVDRAAAWERVNPAMIAGRLTHADAKTYRLYDWTAPGTYEYKLESLALNGLTQEYETVAENVLVDWETPGNAAVTLDGLVAVADNLDAAVGFARAQSRRDACSTGSGLSMNKRSGALASGAGPAAVVRSVSRVSDPENEIVERATFPAAHEFAAAMRAFSAAPVGGSRSTVAAKAVYDSPGVLVIRQVSLPGGFDIRRAAIEREGRRVTALALTQDTLVLSAPGYRDEYTDKDAFFLRRSTAPTAAGTLSHAQGLFDATQAVNTDTPTSVTAEFHDVYFDYNLRPYDYPPWFSAKYLTSGTTQSFTLDTPFASGGAAALSVNVWSLTQGASGSSDHALFALVNGQPAGQAQWSGGGKMMELSFQIPSGVLKNGSNTIELATPVLPGVESQISFLHSIKATYTRSLDGSQPVEILNAGTRANIFEVSNVPGAGAWIVDERFPDRAALAPFQMQSQADGVSKLRFTAQSGGTGRYRVVPFGQENAVLSVSKRTIKAVKPAPYLAVGPNQFSTGVQPLLLQRSKEGLRAAFVDQEQIFDYYNYGRYGPAGIQNAVRAVRPHYLLLLGRTTYDYRNYSGNNVDPLCPAFLVSTNFWAQATSDSMYGDLGRGFPEVAVGRLPVNDAAELSEAVQRILANRGTAGSEPRIHVVTDRDDPAVGDFSVQADELKASIPDASWQKNYLGITCQTTTEANAAMTNAANGGADWIMYLGHGSAAHLGKDEPHILDTDSVQQWTGNVVLLQATCTANWMAKDESGYRSIAIQALTQPQGGIAASIASSTYMNSEAAAEFMHQLLRNANGSAKRWGDALVKAQQWAYMQNSSSAASAFYLDLGKTEQIFGDPAMPVRAASKQATSTNGGTF